MNLNTPIDQLGRLGNSLAKKLADKLEIRTVQDLLFYFPSRHVDYSLITPIKDLTIDLVTTVHGELALIQNRRGWKFRRMVTEALLNDDTGSLKVTWFNQPYLGKMLKIGQRLALSGTIEKAPHGVTMVAPDFEMLGPARTIHTGRLVPMYPLSQGLSHKQIRTLVAMVLPLAEQVKEWLPLAQLPATSYQLPTLATALQDIHFPKDKASFEAAQHRFRFEELLLLQLRAALARAAWSKLKGQPLPFDQEIARSFVAKLPFTLTQSQKKAAWEILKDLSKSVPMNRLLEGDVGSGKTVVAALAALMTIHNGGQVAVLAPTEILAEQHVRTFRKILEPFGIIPTLVTRNSKLVTRNLTDHTILIGTHALLQDEVLIPRLALVIVDEQHRFGVEQRATLLKNQELRIKNKDAQSLIPNSSFLIPHLLSMTATPIPRTLALTVYGDLDLSVIDEMPADRKPIITKIPPVDKRAAAYEFVDKQIAAGRQTFVICPLVDPSDKLGVKSATAEYERLQKTIFAHRRLGLLHGKLKSKEKTEIMGAFNKGELDILISTAVVEVGVDIPNASVMMIEGAERFGLAQLHQFRGRVGRSSHQSYCILFTEKETDEVRARLQAFLEAKNGFELAEKDLHIRGSGELFGTEQSGFSKLNIASLFDYKTVQEAQTAAAWIMEQDQTLKKFPEIKEKLANFELATHWE